MTPRLEKCFIMRAYLDKADTLDLKTIRNGANRMIIPITHGTVEGSGLSAKITQGGSDWLEQDTKLNIAYINVRTQARSSEGHALYFHYKGVLKIDEASGKVLTWAADAKTTEFGDHECFVAPMIETSDEKFKWVESSLFVGEARFVVDDGGSAIEYQIFKVVN